MAIRYIYENSDWPDFRWDHEAVSPTLADINFRRGTLLAAMASLGFQERQDTILHVLIADVTKSSQIEGEKLNDLQVRSSIARNLGMDFAGLPTPDRHVEGVVEMMLDATQNYVQPLTQDRIFAWHGALFPTGRSGMHKIAIGTWRDDSTGPMQVVSGPIGQEKVHYQAPQAKRVPNEIAKFLTWFEGASVDPVIKAAIAHLWFVTIHPLDDGNGRIGRAIMDQALARADHSAQRFYSMSEQIQKDRNGYYDTLERTQKGSLDVTEWVQWFLAKLDSALESAERVLQIVRRKQAFWDAHHDSGLNARQSKIINMLFDGFRGKLQTSKYAAICKCSNDTALRDLAELVDRGILVKEAAGGRSTSYVLVA